MLAAVNTTTAAGSGGGTSSATLAASTTQIGTAGGLVFNITYDSSVTGAPAGFTAAIAYVAQLYASNFNSPITINLDVGWGEIAGQAMSSGALGESDTYLNSYSYSQVRSALVAKATSSDQKTAVATLPTSAPAGSASYSIATAEAKALGLIGGSSSLDGYVGFGSAYSYTFDPNNRAVSGAYDFISVAAHEISEVMGRGSYLGEGLGYTALDLFRYSSAGTRQLTAGRTAYFSIDGGSTNLNNFNTVSGGDSGDWASTASNDAYNAFSNSGVVNAISATDLREMNILGYALAGGSSPAPPPPSAPAPPPTPPPPSAPAPPTVAGQFNYVGSWTSAGLLSEGDRWYVGDFNGDGKDDVFRYGPGVSGADVFLSNGSAFNQVGSWTTAGLALTGDRWYVGDFNGDGKDDIFRYVPGQSGADMFLSAGSGFSEVGNWSSAGLASGERWYVGDFNGDGKADIFRYIPGQSGADMFLSTGSGFAEVGSWTSAGLAAGEQWYVGDFNGDGKDDLFRYLPGQSGADMFLSTGSGFSEAGSWTSAGLAAGERWYVGDFNGDGKTDIMRYLPGTGSDVLLSSGSGFQDAGVWTAASPSDGWYTGDFNGNGSSDLFRYLPGTSGADMFLR